MRMSEEVLGCYLRLISPSPSEVRAARALAFSIMRRIEDVATRHRILRGASWRLMGSVERGTSLTPIDDVDVMLTIPRLMGSVASAGPQCSPLEAVNLLAEQVDPLDTGLAIDDDRCGLRYTKRAGPRVEIVPAVPKSSGGFWIPADYAHWRMSDPPGKAAFTQALDVSSRGTFRPTVRLLKAWKRYWIVPLRAWHLEAMAGALHSKSNAGGYASALCRFFEQAETAVDLPDPDGVGGPFLLEADQRLRTSELLAIGLQLTEAAAQLPDKASPSQCQRTWSRLLGA